MLAILLAWVAKQAKPTAERSFVQFSRRIKAVALVEGELTGGVLLGRPLRPLHSHKSRVGQGKEMCI